MRPTVNQRAALLSLADYSAEMRFGTRHYRLRNGRGEPLATSTAASLVRHGWATVAKVSDRYILTVTPEGLGAVVAYL